MWLFLWVRGCDPQRKEADVKQLVGFSAALLLLLTLLPPAPPTPSALYMSL